MELIDIMIDTLTRSNGEVVFLDTKRRHIYFLKDGELRRRNQYSNSRVGRKIVNSDLLVYKDLKMIKLGD